MQPVPRRVLLAMTLALEGGLLVLAHLLGRIFDASPWQTAHWNLSGLLVGGAATLPLLLLLFLSVRASWMPLRQLCHSIQEMTRSFFSAATWMDLAIVACLAGVCEETFFRGFLHSLLAREWNQSVALLVTATLFALAHPVSRLSAGIAAGMSLYLGGLYVASQNLLPPIVAHGLYDFLAILYWQRRARENASGRVVSGPA